MMLKQEVSGYPSLFHAYLHGASVVINHVEASFPPLLEWCKDSLGVQSPAFVLLIKTVSFSSGVLPQIC